MMNEDSKYIFRCPVCGHCAEVRKYPSVNASSEPNLRLKILDGSLLRWVCPACGETTYAEYPLLYHDPGRKFMIWMVPYSAYDPNIEEYGLKVARLLPDYTCRKVDNVLRLAEKIQIFEQGASDVAVELSEYVFRQESGASGNFFFHGIRFDGGLCRELRISVVKADGGHEYYNVSPEIYTDCEAIVERNSDMKPGPGFVRVDYSWIMSKLK